jgi:hypothetical protein
VGNSGPEPAGAGKSIIEMQRVAISGEIGKSQDIANIENLFVKGFHPHDKILKAISLPAHPLRPQNARLRMLMPSFGG